MASAKIVLGGEIDVCTSDEMKDGFDSFGRDMMGAMAKPKRILRPLSASTQFGAITSGAPIQLIAGRPTAGRLWVVTRLVVVGVDDSSTLANALAAVYVGDSSNLSLSQVVRPGTSVPFQDTANEHAYVVHDREDLFINISAGAAAVGAGQVVFNALAWEYKDSDIDTQRI